MKMRNKLLYFAKPVLLIPVLGCFFNCVMNKSGADSVSEVFESDIYYSSLDDTSDMTDATHTKLDVDEIITNTDTIFDTSSVQKLRIVIEPDNWTLMNANLAYLSYVLGKSTDFSSIDNPFFVPCSVFYNGTEWYKVGVRFKGNSSLYNANSNKLPFKLDFDEFEDQYPAIKNQRFYGFKQLNLKSNYNDESEMHEIVAAQLFKDFGLTSPHCSFYELYLNVDGSNSEANDIFYGVYTLVEEIDDTVIKTQFYNNDDGNLYKPEDSAATFAAGTYNEDEFGLKTDDDESYTDIALLYSTINSTTRTSNSTLWKTNLESILDVDTFLKWLAANTVMQNWDTYGVMDHNFFLYYTESTKFQWIPWDGNEALEANSQCLSLDMSNVGSDWPLISYILAEDSYKEIYDGYVNDFANDYFDASSSSDNVYDYYEYYKNLISSYVYLETSSYSYTSHSEFTSAYNTLLTHAASRYTAAKIYSPD